jgi:hypothetical protein
MKTNGFTLTGTTGSTFQGVQSFAAGSIGYRNIGGEKFRIRVVPNNGKTLVFDSNWKTPDYDGNRYSVVVNGLDALVQTVAAATRVLAAASIVEIPAQPEVYIPASPARIEIQ